MSSEILDKAVLNNADWCQAVCESHGVATSRTSSIWCSSIRTPLYYPDAITLVRSCEAAEVVQEIDLSPGCSVKDSYADVDLSSGGFEVLFEASWICRPAEQHLPGVVDENWQQVTTKRELEEWQRAWDDSVEDELFNERLLLEPSVTVLACRVDGQIVAGSIINQSRGVVGVSNLFCPDGSEAETWAAVVAAAEPIADGQPIVGYEHGNSLDAALTAGFEAIGPLRVWLR